VSLGYLRAPAPPGLLDRLLSRRGPAGPADPSELLPDSLPALRALLERFVEAGFSKFVLRPVAPLGPWEEELEALAGAVLDLQR
jgi:hypothetical protein